MHIWLVSFSNSNYQMDNDLIEWLLFTRNLFSCLNLILFADNAGVIVNPKGEMKGESLLFL